VAAALLQSILGGGAGGGDTGGGGSLMGDLASSMLGDMGGGLFGSLLGGGGGGGGSPTVTTSGSVSVIPDARLNALVVQASPRDLDTVEQLLKIVDQQASPEAVQTAMPPRFIPVFNGAADEMAVVVRQVYAGRIAADANQARQPSPEDFVRALRGGGGGGRGGQSGQSKTGEEQKMTIGVDTRTNSLIVSAPDYLFNEVKALVAQLDTDTIAADADETVKVVTLKRTNSDLIQRSLTSMLGPGITANTTAAASQRGATSTTASRTTANRTATGRTSNAQANQAGSFQPQNANSQDQMRQRLEMFNAMSGAGGGGRSARGGGGGGNTGRGGGGGGGFRRP